MANPVLQFKRGNLASLPGLRAGEPGFTVDKYDLYVGIDSTTTNNQLVGSSRYWTKETTTTGSGVNLVEGTNNGTNKLTLKAPATIASDQTYTFPAAAVNTGYLKSDGSGGLTWDTTPNNIAAGGAGASEVNVAGVGTITYFKGTHSNVTGVTTMASAQVSDLTNGRVVLAGTGGELEDNANLAFNGTQLTVTGNQNTTGNLSVGGNLTISGSVTQINTVNTTIEDVLLELQVVDGSALGSDTNKDVGVVMNYYSGSAKKAAVFWDDSTGRIAIGAEVSETSSVLTVSAWGALEIGSLYLNDCAGATQVISCSGTTRSLENITIDGGSF